MGEHVDRARLETDIRYRFDYLAKFLNFTSNDILILNSLEPILFPTIPSLIEMIDKKIQSFASNGEVSIEDNNNFREFINA